MRPCSAARRIGRPLPLVCSLALIVAIGAAPAAAAARQHDFTDQRFGEWLEAVETHRPGEHDEAAVRTLAWGVVELDLALRRFKTGLRRADFNDLALRAATLHADIAMWQWDARQGIGEPPPAPGASEPGRSLILIIDGRYIETGAVTVHWSFARRLIDTLRPTPLGHDFARVWYKATTAYLVRNSSYSDALAHVERAKQLFPDDAFFEVAAGCISEALASARVQEGARQAGVAGGSGRGRSSMPDAAASLANAESSFTRAVKLDPGLIEARLRLGRVLARRGNTSAAAHFEAVLAGTSDDTLRYYAFLFRGERLEAVRQFAAAERAYKNAAFLFPRAQSPMLALNHLARRNGNRATAERLSESLGSLDRPDDRDDPWWYYEFGIGRDAETLLAALYAALTKGSR